MIPKLPTSGRLTSYIDRIDEARWYTNFGPLNTELEARHARRLGLEVDRVVTVTNATVGLTLALRAVGAPTGSLCVMPAWTFIASPLAAIQAGLMPHFVDVDPATWTLTPDIVRSVMTTIGKPIGAIMPVIPFGAPTDLTCWDAFSDTTGIPVVIDAAACIDALRPVRSVSIVSLHATKLLPAGEGGLAVSTDPAILARLRSLSAFGFQNTRVSFLPGLNGKLSEYHAAVGLASLDEWDETRACLMAIARRYADGFASVSKVRIQPGFGTTWLSSTCVLAFDRPAAKVETALSDRTIASRRWWEYGSHLHPATDSCPRGPLPHTEHLARTTLGVPFHVDLGPEDVDVICGVIAKALA